MPNKNIPGDMRLTVAGLSLVLNLNKQPLTLKLPPSHSKFLQNDTAEVWCTSAVFDELIFNLINHKYIVESSETTPLCRTEIWELWREGSGEFRFIAPRLTPPRSTLVNPAFSSAKLYGEFWTLNGADVYPLQTIDMRIIINWLANFGDLILHAAGIAFDGKGYAFVGVSGAGKSTVVEALSQEKCVTVLGEDQVVLRYHNRRFWIYGTPWHERPAMCSPIGVPLEKLFLLDRQNVQVLSSPTPLDVVLRVMQTAFIPFYRPESVETILGRLASLPKQVACFTLSYQLGSDIFNTITSA